MKKTILTMKPLTKLKRATLAVLVMLVLAGCNSESSNDSSTDDSDPGSIDASLSADFAQIAIVLDEETNQQAQPVNMGVYVTVAEGDSAQLTRIDSLSEGGQCDALVSVVNNSLLFDTAFVDGTACTYQYRVENEKGEFAEEIVQVNATKNTPGHIAFYETVHQNISMGSGDVIFKLDELITPLPGFTLDESSVLASQNGEASGDPSNNEITFTPETDGLSEIYYAMSDMDNSRVISGVIRVAISVSANQSPEINHVAEEEGEIYTDITLDMSTYITDADNDALQIEQIHTDQFTTASVDEINDPMVLTIRGTLPGNSTISYNVTDHNGGYATGEIRVNFSQVQQGGELNDGSLFFSAPILWSEVVNADKAVDGKMKAGPEDAITGYVLANNQNWKDSPMACLALGLRSPSIEELDKIYDENNDLDVSHGWSISHKFMSSTRLGGSGYQTINMVTGQHGDQDASYGTHGQICVSDRKPNTQPQVTPQTIENMDIYQNTTMAIEATDAEDAESVLYITEVVYDDARVSVTKDGGLDLTIKALTPGQHVLTVVVEDSQGLTGTANVTISATSKVAPHYAGGILMANPLLLSTEQLSVGDNGTSYIDHITNYSYYTGNWPEAQEACTAKGLRIPPVDDVNKWFSALPPHTTPGTFSWPYPDKGMWANSSEGNSVFVKFDTGAAEYLDSDEAETTRRAVMCVLSQDVSNVRAILPKEVLFRKRESVSVMAEVNGVDVDVTDMAVLSSRDTGIIETDGGNEIYPIAATPGEVMIGVDVQGVTADVVVPEVLPVWQTDLTCQWTEDSDGWIVVTSQVTAVVDWTGDTLDKVQIYTDIADESFAGLLMESVAFYDGGDEGLWVGTEPVMHEITMKQDHKDENYGMRAMLQYRPKDGRYIQPIDWTVCSRI